MILSTRLALEASPENVKAGVDLDTISRKCQNDVKAGPDYVKTNIYKS
jgi:hypothetical protein